MQFAQVQLVRLSTRDSGGVSCRLALNMADHFTSQRSIFVSLHLHSFNLSTFAPHYWINFKDYTLLSLLLILANFS